MAERRAVARVVLPTPPFPVKSMILILPASIYLDIINVFYRYPRVSQYPIGHKFALKKMKKGEKIIKYGEMIGRATQPIEEGDQVHIHNVESTCMAGEISKVASGKGAKSEALGHNEFAIFRERGHAY